MNMGASEGIKLSVPRAEAARQGGRPAEFDDAFRAHYPRLIQLLARMTGDRARAEELASEVFCRLASRPLLFAPGNNFVAWIFRTATNLGLDALRVEARRRRNERAAAAETARTANPADPLQEFLAGERQRRVRATLAGLKPVSARLLLLRHSGFSYGELACVLKLNPASVGKLLMRAMDEFEKSYKEQHEERR